VTEVTEKVERAIARFDRVTSQLDQRGGPARDAARRERQRLNSGLGRTAVRVLIATGVIWLATLIFGFIEPIGMFGFAAALLLTSLVAIWLIASGTREAVTPPAPSVDLPNGAMVDRFDSYLYRVRRALPAPAQTQLDAITAALPSLKQSLDRVPALDSDAQDARRLMSTHLPGLIERYARVPSEFRAETAGEDKSVDERLVDGLAAGRAALGEISEKLAQRDVAAFETQGRFIEARYGDRPLDAPSETTSD
jgi:hypothetical protein